jgi:DNA mismatch repair protein MutL
LQYETKQKWYLCYVQDIINLLPDHIANQIAAGEVIQRPASAVKEMLENAIDAGATHIHLIIKDAGKELIKVNDNGKGMSITDARMSFERHATSKILKIEDLFSIRTMGFRGEALASIAAVAQVELKTKQSDQEAGTYLVIENSTVLKQEPCAIPDGTSISVKNLFFNIPARRNFLKSNTTEIRNIVDEFTRVSMAFFNVSFTFTNNEADIFVLEAGSLKQRIIQLLGNTHANKLVHVEENTDYVKINGFVGTPANASKNRGNQFVFVNNRFIKSAYLNHAVKQAYQQIISNDEHPMFVLFLDLDPTKVDANVHPTKQEIKFEDEKIMYAFVNSAVKHALSKNSISPSLDFSINTDIAHLPSITQPFTSHQRASAESGYLHNSFQQSGQAHLVDNKNSLKNWQDAYAITNNLKDFKQLQIDNHWQTESGTEPTANNVNAVELDPHPFQLLIKYIVYPKQNGMLLINVKAAMERIVYNKLQEIVNNKSQSIIQKCLHPHTFSLTPVDAILLLSILKDLNFLGFEVEDFGNNSFIIQGVPTDITKGQEINAIKEILEQHKIFNMDAQLSSQEKLIYSIAWQQAQSVSKILSSVEIKSICDKLFITNQPEFTPRGQKIFVQLADSDLEIFFKNEKS